MNNKLLFLLASFLLLNLSCSEIPSGNSTKPKEIYWQVRYPVWISDTRIAAFIQREIPYEGAFVYEFDAYSGDNPVCLTQKDSLAKINLVVSPDRTKLVYGAADAGKLFSAQKLYVLDRVTGQVTRVTQESHNENPEFSPDGSMLIFDSGYRISPPQNGGDFGAGEVWKVHLQNIDGTGRRPLDPPLSWGDWDGHFLPDGKHIVLRSWRTTNLTPTREDPQVYLTDLSGSSWRNLDIENSGSSYPRPSPDGRSLLIYSEYGADYPGDDPRDNPPGLKLLDLAKIINATTYSRVPPNKPLRFPLNWSEAKWSPDGNWIAFRANPLSSDWRHQLFVIRPDGTDLRQLTKGYDVPWFNWSLDSKRIVFSHYWIANADNEEAYHTLYIVSITTGQSSKMPIKLSFTK